MKREPRYGDKIMVLQGTLEGSTGTIRKVYKNGMISASFDLKDLKTEFAQLVSPEDDTVHYVFQPGEFEITGDQKGVF